MDINNAQHWEELLSNLCVPNTETVRKATDIVQQSMQHSTSFLMLFKLVQSSNIEQVRHLAAILCRRSVRKHWDAVPQQVQQEIRSVAFQIILNPSTPHNIRKSVADIISRIMQKSHQWDGFLENLTNLVNSNERSHRDVGIYLFQSLIDTEELRVSIIQPHSSNILDIIEKGLKDPEQDVRIRSLACANSFLNHMQETDPIVPKYIQLLPSIINVINFSLEDSDDRVAVGFEILSTLTEDFMSYLQPMVPDLLRFTLSVGANTSLDVSLRQHALYFIEFMIDNKPKSFLANACLQDVIQLSFIIMTEEYENDEESLKQYGSQIIDVLAIEIPSKFVWQPIMDRVAQYVASPRAIDRSAAIIAVTVISEGCADRVEENIATIMPWIIAGLRDENSVRQSALVAVSEFAKNISDAIEPYHETLVPLLLEASADGSDMICIKAYYAISHYMVCDPETLLPHFEVLLKHLMNGLDHKNMEVKELALNALSAAISMANERFEPYFNQTIGIMKNWMGLMDQNTIIIRNRATECMAMLASAVRREMFLPHLKEVITTALQGLEHIDDAEMREFIYRFIEQLARKYADELSEYYPIIIPYLLASCESSAGLVCLKDDDEMFQIFPEGEAPTADQELKFHILASFMDEKAAAASCLGWMIAENCDAAASYIEASIHILAGLSIFDLYPPVASTAVVALCQAVGGMLKFLEEDFTWQKGKISPIPEVVESARQVVFGQYEKIMALREQSIVRAAMESIGKLSLTFGPSAVMPNMRQIVTWLCLILSRQADFQVNRESFDENEEDFVTFTVILDIMVELSKTCGELFVPYLPDLFNCFSPYLGDEVPSEYKECVLCTIWEVAEEIGNSFQPFCGAFLPIFLQAMNPSNDDNIIQYACCCLRKTLLCGNLPDATVNEIWGVVNHLMTQDSSRMSLFDSIHGLIAQLVLSSPKLCSLDQVLPVLLNGLPMKVNTEPSSVVYQCILQNLYAGHSILLNNIGQIVELFAIEIIAGDIKEDTKMALTDFLHQLAQSQKEVIDSSFNSLLQKQLADTQSLTHLRNIL